MVQPRNTNNPHGNLAFFPLLASKKEPLSYYFRLLSELYPLVTSGVIKLSRTLYGGNVAARVDLMGTYQGLG